MQGGKCYNKSYWSYESSVSTHYILAFLTLQCAKMTGYTFLNIRIGNYIVLLYGPGEAQNYRLSYQLKKSTPIYV